jgi:hypothetical protein
MNQSRLIPLIFVVFAFFYTSCSSFVGLREVQSGLDDLVGTNYSTNPRVKLKNWSKIEETKTHIELEQTLQTGCSYAILVNKGSDIIESWRFTSAQELCEQKVYVPGV